MNNNKLLGGFVAAAFTVSLCSIAYKLDKIRRDAQPEVLPDTRHLPHSIGLTSVGNARELGGYSTVDGRVIKHGVLLRGAELSRVSDDDIRILKDDYHISEVIDFRMSSEVKRRPDIDIPGVKNVNIRILDEEEYSRASKKMGIRDISMLLGNARLGKLELAIKMGYISYRMYIDYLSTECAKSGYRKFFDELLNLPKDRAVLFHCTQGKDRTGLASMLILAALGVDEDTILRDYVLTNEYNAEKTARQYKMLEGRGYSKEKKVLLMAAMDRVSPRIMKKVQAWLNEKYGSPLGYIIDELGITSEKIEHLKEKFLETT